MVETNCRHFNGYKPCGKSEVCHSGCPFLDRPQVSILIVHLGALGAVVRSTSLLKAIKRKFPSSRVTWVTDAPAHQLLQGHPSIDRVLTTSLEDQLILRALSFEIGFVIDKSLKAMGVFSLTSCDYVYGFKADSMTGAIVPATVAAEELWCLGLSNAKKFFENKKPETQLLIEALELGEYERLDYDLHLTESEVIASKQRKTLWQKDSSQVVIGFNTGCANVIPAKKWTVEYHRIVIQALLMKGFKNIVLLGGPEDTIRNAEIAAGLSVFSSATTLGLRDGLVSINACDLVVTGDSLGMHMAIAMKKYVIAWFGPTCAHEIELYGRGEALLADVSCSPCWKRSCEKDVMCYDQIGLERVMSSIEQGVRECQKQQIEKFSTSKRLFSETSA